MIYTTETGLFVLVDDEGRVMGRADVPMGDHPISEPADPNRCYDVKTLDDLQNVDIDPHYTDLS